MSVNPTEDALLVALDFEGGVIIFCAGMNGAPNTIQAYTALNALRKRILCWFYLTPRYPTW
jgi:hypothetical protein